MVDECESVDPGRKIDGNDAKSGLPYYILVPVGEGVEKAALFFFSILDEECEEKIGIGRSDGEELTVEASRADATQERHNDRFHWIAFAVMRAVLEELEPIYKLPLSKGICQTKQEP